MLGAQLAAPITTPTPDTTVLTRGAHGVRSRAAAERDGVERALADEEVDAIYLLTDGVPSRGAETRRKGILDEIDYLNRFRLVQINCVQAGSSDGLGSKWKGFLEDLARRHDGVSVRE